MANEVVITSRRGVAPFYTNIMSDGLSRHANGLGIGFSTTTGAPYFLPRDLRDAYDWLTAQTDLSDVVLAPDYICTFIPYLSGNKVYYGHGYVTSDMQERLARANAFYYDEQTDMRREAFLVSQHIDYVVYWSGMPVDDVETKKFVQLMEQSLSVELAYQNSRALIFRTTFQ